LRGLPEKIISAPTDEVVPIHLPEMLPHPTLGFPSDEYLALTRASNNADLIESRYGNSGEPREILDQRRGRIERILYPTLPPGRSVERPPHGCADGELITLLERTPAWDTFPRRH
jgi:hypothetical protein